MNISSIAPHRTQPDNVTTMMGTTTNTTSDTAHNVDLNLALQIAQKLAFIAVFTIMFGLGCSASINRIVNFIKKPKHFLTGVSLQLILLPLFGFAISRILSLDMPKTLGLLLLSSSPGGTYSNIVTYWLDGDMDLRLKGEFALTNFFVRCNIIMTTVSTLLAMGFMPMWLLIFTSVLQLEETLKVPFGWLGIGLASMVVPVLLGLGVQHFFPSKSRLLTKIFTILGSFFVLGIMGVSISLGLYVDVARARPMLSVALLIVCAFGTGYATTRIPFLNFTQSERRTVAIEIMFQSAPVAFNVILISYHDNPAPVVAYMVSLPFFYASMQLMSSVIAITSYLLMKRFGFTYFVPNDEIEAENKDDEELATNVLMTDEKE